MKKNLLSLFIIVMGFSLLGFSSFLKNHGDGIVFWTAKINEHCAVFSKKCTALDSILNELNNGGLGAKRQALSKDELPIVRIYMSDGSVRKLDDKRNSVLAKRRPIHIAAGADWVKGTVFVEYEGKKEKSKTSIRLKGDWGDHLEDPKKLSFRIKTREGGYLFGMKAFSIQHPTTRRYGNEPLIFNQMRTHDILVPRYSFADVFVNDFPIGVMAIEEHFRKEMIEAQNRRDGPLLALNEDALWEQWDINYNAERPAGDDRVNFWAHRDSMIKDFNKSKFSRGSIPTNNVIRGQALLRDFYDGKVTSSESFDYEKLSKYWILVNIWGGCHSATWHNRRYYFNPISGLLEPVGFDNIGSPENFKVCSDVDIKTSLNDPKFIDQVVLSAQDIYQELQSPSFAQMLSENQRAHTRVFDYEGFKSRPPSVSSELLVKNLRELLIYLSDENESFGRFDKAYMRQPPKTFGQKFLKMQPNIFFHMSSFYYPEESKGAFEFRNLTLEPITVTRIYIPGKRGKTSNLDIQEFNLASSLTSSGIAAIDFTLSDEVLSKHSELGVEYKYQGQTYTRPVYVQFKNSPTGFVPDPIAAMRKMDGHKWIDVAGQQIIFAAGAHNFTESIALPKGWRVTLQAGTEFNFQSGSLLKIRGPLIVQGTKPEPVVVNVESHMSFKDMGSWGGLFVSQSEERSLVNYLILNGNGVQNLNTRQGFYGMTGCLTFYESDVDINNSKFVDAQCEDALNIVKADFKLDNILIEGARADAFDSDFSTGLITNSEFVASGNDGVDVSGTVLNLENIIMTDIGDKAVSVGEKSTLIADGIAINGAVLGLVSKDLSDAKAKNVKFENISGTAIMTYIKKQEYGPSRLECDSCSFLSEMSRTGAQEGTTIILEGKTIAGASLSKKQMYDSGLIELGL